LTHTLVRQ